MIPAPSNDLSTTFSWISGVLWLCACVILGSIVYCQRRWLPLSWARKLRIQRSWVVIDPKKTDAETGGYPTVVVPPGRVAVFVFVNGKSGGQLGSALLLHLRRILDSVQVIDLSETNPEVVVSMLKRHHRGPQENGRVRLLCCGGDGTVGWVLQACRNVGISFPVAVLPLGTGNDLSRAFGWGPGVSSVDRTLVVQYLASVWRSRSALLDQWKVTIEHRGVSVKQLLMHNYFSLGIDAAAALKFHEERQRHPERFSSQTANVIKYALLGLEGAFDGVPLGHELRVTDTASSKDMEMNPLWKGMVVGNVPCYQGGKQFWGREPSQSHTDFFYNCTHDKQLEVMALSGSLHIGLVHLSIDNAIQLGRAGGLRINVVEDTAMQVDGEPWLQKGPCTVSIEHVGQCHLLRPNTEL